MANGTLDQDLFAGCVGLPKTISSKVCRGVDRVSGAAVGAELMRPFHSGYKLAERAKLISIFMPLLFSTAAAAAVN